MHAGDLKLFGAALFGVALSVVLIVRVRLHPFVALLCGAFATGLLGGLGPLRTAEAVQKGAGDILGGAGLVIALGLALGAMLQLSDGAGVLARAGLRRAGERGAPWASLLIALGVGLPLFFETGLVLLLPIVAAAAEPGRGDARLRLMLPALAGLSVVHALVPPHPGPILAVQALHADLARTLGYGLMVAAPVAVLAGPLLAGPLSRGVRSSAPVASAPTASDVRPPSAWRALLVVLLPVGLIAGGQVAAMVHAPSGWAALGQPVPALLLAVLAAPPLLFGRRCLEPQLQAQVWSEALRPAGPVLLAIGAGGALKQVLVAAGLADLLARTAEASAAPPLVLAWLVAVGVRLATGSATVATITSAGVMATTVARTGASPEWTVLAIGAGSVFFSHVNDPGFWLVRSYLGVDTPATFRTWSVLETVISVAGLLLVLLFSRFV